MTGRLAYDAYPHQKHAALKARPFVSIAAESNPYRDEVRMNGDVVGEYDHVRPLLREPNASNPRCDACAGFAKTPHMGPKTKAPLHHTMLTIVQARVMTERPRKSNKHK